MWPVAIADLCGLICSVVLVQRTLACGILVRVGCLILQFNTRHKIFVSLDGHTSLHYKQCLFRP